MAVTTTRNTSNSGDTRVEDDTGNVSSSRLEQIMADPLRWDIEKAVCCDFDDILRSFIFFCLTDESVCEIEKEIEQLEQRNDEKVQAKRAARDTELNKILEDCLTAVLDITRQDNIKGMLGNYHDSLKLEVSKRYAPYIELCNTASEELAKLDQVPLRSASDLVYRRLDVDFECSRGGSDLIEGDPDVGCSSRAAAEKMGQDFHLPPTTTDGACFADWPSVEKFKKVSLKGSTEEKAVISKGYTTARAYKIKHKLEEDVEREEPYDATPKTGTKRKSKGHRNSGRKGKKPRIASNAKGSKRADALEDQSQKSTEGRVQCAASALEMLSSNLGRHHVVSVLHIDDTLSVWYYDRQGILRSNGINIFADFPRFLVLLLVFQRFTSKDWGIIDSFNAPDGSRNTAEKDLLLNVDPGNKMIFEHAQQGSALSSLSVDYGHYSGYLSSKPRFLHGRATRVLKCTGRQKQRDRQDLAIKISYPEVSRVHEGEVLDGIHNLTKEFDKEPKSEAMRMEQHLPEVIFYADVVGTGTRLIRSLVKVETKGQRVMRVVVMKQLCRLTDLSGFDLICAWLDAVTCHAFLWKHGVQHGDPSLENVMYHPETGRGVLTDFDLSLKQWAPHVVTERTGTIPFMALDLLREEYWDGHIVQRYHHELEAFIWILPYLCLMETVDGAHDRFIKEWSTAKTDKCRLLKYDFLYVIESYTEEILDKYSDCFAVAEALCHALLAFISETRPKTRRGPWFKKQLPPVRELSHHEISKKLWDAVLDVFELPTEEPEEDAPKALALTFELVKRLKQHQPTFADLNEADKKKFEETYGAVPHPRPSEMSLPKLTQSGS